MSCELPAISHAHAQTVNKQPPIEAQTKYSCLDVALGRTGDDCTRYIMIAAAIVSLGATIVGAGILDAISAAWSWATGPSANAEEIVVIPTTVDELPATDKPVAAVITEVTDKPVAIVAKPVETKDPKTVEAPKDDSYRITRLVKSGASSIKHYGGAAFTKTRDAAVATPGFINSHRKETAGTVTAVAMAYLGYQYGGTVLSATWSQVPSWQRTKDNAEWFKDNTWGRMFNSTTTP